MTAILKLLLQGACVSVVIFVLLLVFGLMQVVPA